MVDSGYLRPATANRIKTTIRKRAFLTRLQLADPPRSIALDRNGLVVPAQEVHLVWANRTPTGEGSDTTDVLGIEGELQRWQVLDAEVGDRFMIDGRLAEITSPVVVEKGVARAGFRVTTGGG